MPYAFHQASPAAGPPLPLFAVPRHRPAGGVPVLGGFPAAGDLNPASGVERGERPAPRKNAAKNDRSERLKTMIFII